MANENWRTGWRAVSNRFKMAIVTIMPHWHYKNPKFDIYEIETHIYTNTIGKIYG
jgi:hypothetical protein